MRIGMVCPYNFFRPGGVQTCIRELSADLVERGHYVRILAPKPRLIPAKVDKHIILLGGSAELNTPFHTKADIGLTRDRERIDNLFAEEKFDILHVHEPGLPLFGVQLLGRSTAKNIGTMHASLPDSMISKSFEKLMTPVARYIEPRLHAATAVSEVAKEIALGYVPDFKGGIEVIPNGIRIDEFKPNKPQVQGRKKTLLFVGRLERRKGASYLVDAFAELVKKDSNIELVIVGDGRLRSGLEARVKKLGIPNVKFLGFVSEAKKKQLMQKADLFCSPALFGESFGIVLLEAMAAGCVVVAGNNPGYRTVMTGRGKISLVDPTSLDDFVSRIEVLLYDEAIRELWLRWANEYIQQFDYKFVTDKYEDLYKRVLKEK